MGNDFQFVTCGVTAVSKIDFVDDTFQDKEQFTNFSVLVDLIIIETGYMININRILETQNDRGKFWTFGIRLIILAPVCHPNIENESFIWLIGLYNSQLDSFLSSKIYCSLEFYIHTRQGVLNVSGIGNCQMLRTEFLTTILYRNQRKVYMSSHSANTQIRHEKIREDFHFLITYLGLFQPNAHFLYTLTVEEPDALHTILFGTYYNIHKHSMVPLVYLLELDGPGDGKCTMIMVLCAAYGVLDSIMMYCSVRLFFYYALHSRFDRCFSAHWQATAHMVYLPGVKLRHYVE